MKVEIPIKAISLPSTSSPFKNMNFCHKHWIELAGGTLMFVWLSINNSSDFKVSFWDFQKANRKKHRIKIFLQNISKHKYCISAKLLTLYDNPMKVIHENLYFKRSNFEKSSVEGTRVPASLEKVNFSFN